MRAGATGSLLGALAELARSRPVEGGIDDMVWTLCHQAAEPLDLPDCVVYLLDRPGGALLEQRAAYGPKNPRSREILDPITIPVGRGIVGSVAASGRAERVADTSRDARYILDDDFRFSELAVPILSQGEVIGVLDSEHPDKQYYRRDQLDALTVLLNMWSERLGAAWKQASREAANRSSGSVKGLGPRLGSLGRELGMLRRPDEKRRALGVLQHELRTPLNALLGYAELLDSPESGTGLARKEMVAALLRNGRQLEDRLAKLLALPELFWLDAGNAGRRLYEVDLATVVRDAVEAAAAPGRDVSLRTDLPAGRRVITHPASVKSIVRLLMDNAVSYTEEGSITVRIGRRGEQPYVQVEDTGCGIPQDSLHRVFEPFYQVAAGELAVRRGGLGLGLAVADKLSRQLAYRLEVESSLGVGSEFRLELTGADATPAESPG